MAGPSQPLLQELQQFRRQHAGIAEGLVERLAVPGMVRADDGDAAHREARLLQRRDETLRLADMIDDVVLAAIGDEEGRLIVGYDDIAQRRGIKIDLAI